MNKKIIIPVISFILLAMMFSLSVYGRAVYQASASSTGAVAMASYSVPYDFLARASINSTLYNANDIDQGIKSRVYAQVSSSDLTDVSNWPPTNSYATIWQGSTELQWDSWSR